jgi:3-oxoacyl-[acyl-carrier-protein] synthase-3
VQSARSIGDIEVTPISDGVLQTSLDVVLKLDRAEKESLSGKKVGDPVHMSVNTFLLKMNGKYALVDAGSGNTMGPTLGRVPESLRAAGVTPDQIGFIVVGTTTPDTIFPSTACLLQNKIGATRAWGFDLGAACSGFTYALTTAMQMVATGAHDHALAVGADVMSSIIDYTDRTTCVLFGDGAGAVVVSPAADDEPAIIGFAHEIDGSGGPSLCMPAGGSRMPASHETVDKRLHYVKQDGQAVFKFAVRKTEEIARRVLSQNGIDASEIDLFVSHQANRRIITAAAERLGLPESKVIINLEMYGNTTAGTIPLALADAVRDGRLKKGDLVLLASVGAGFTVGSVLLRWSV